METKDFYKKTKEFFKKHGKKILFEEYELSKQENYAEIVKRLKKQSA